MKRDLLVKLVEWKKAQRRKPLVLHGVRQSGKTWLLKEFARLHYSDSAYFNFESQPDLKGLFSGEINLPSIISALSAIAGFRIKPGETLVVFDEIQECPNALNSLKYFCEDAPDYHVATAGSLLGIILSGGRGFPVGKVNFLDLYPMTFSEFLFAADPELKAYHDGIENIARIPDALLKRLEQHFRNYLIVGGMPEAVNAWLSTGDFHESDTVQNEILKSYELDFAKHAPKADIPKLFMMWKSIPSQLARENAKFIYGEVKSGARARDLEDALRWLCDAGLVYRVNRIERPCIPPSAYVNPKSFKLYLCDTGLLRRLAGIPASSILTTPDIFGEFKGRLAENFVLTELKAILHDEIHYWSSGNLAELDYIIRIGNSILPVEVKSGLNVKSKSLLAYRTKYSPEIALRFSQLNIDFKNGLLNIPLSMISRLPRLLEAASQRTR